MRAFNESQSHTDQAQEYKKEQNTALIKELDTRLSEYAKSLSSDQKEHIKSNITSHIDAKTAEMERGYLAMRSKRGEKITIQDMDDIMPYLRLAMLRDLHTYIADRSSEGANALKAEITALEGQIAKTKKGVAKLKLELEGQKSATDEAFNDLWTSDEYTRLLETHTALGKNEWSLEAWKSINEIVSGTDNPDEIKQKTEKLKEDSQVENKLGLLIGVKSVIWEIEQKVSTIDQSNAGNYATTINAFITEFNAWFWADSPYTLFYKPILEWFKAQLESIKNGQANDIQNFININKTSYDNDLSADISYHSSQKELYGTIISYSGTIGSLRTKVADNIATLEADKSMVESGAKLAKEEFKKKVEAIKPLIESQTTAAKKLGQAEWRVSTLSAQKKIKNKKATEQDTSSEQSSTAGTSLEAEKKSTDASQKIRINARNLIVRSGPEKKAKPLLTDDKKKAIMLQPGDSVTPLLDASGNVETQEDGPREYTHVKLDDGTEGWISLSDKIGSKWKQEYGDISMGTESRGAEYQLKGDNIRLRSGAKTTADILDVLDTKKVKSIQALKYSNNNAGDIVEGDGKLWRLVEVTYKNDKKEKGYIAVDLLQEKTSDDAAAAQQALDRL